MSSILFSPKLDTLTAVITARNFKCNLNLVFLTYIYKLTCEKEEADITSATKLLEERREMAEVEQAFVAQKEEFQMRMV